MKTAVIVLMTVVMISVVGLAADDPGSAEIELTGGERGNVPFPHQRHQAALGDCKLCHELFPKQKGGIEDLKAKGELKKRQVMNKHCIKCHNARKRAGQPSGPTSCNDCHVKS
jgi:hypothetical protein